ncbi:MAG: CvpA family protein [Clostridiales bacterium]|nr:CvpA family protein [Clostridiales bacterium]
MNVEFVITHWLAFAVGIFLLAMVLYGHYRGFIRLAVTMSALVISLVVMQVAAPLVTDFVRTNTGLQEVIGEALSDRIGADKIPMEIELPAQQREVIENLNLPEQMKDALLENNNSEIYRILGVDAFVDYLSCYLANMVLNVIGSLILFLLTFVLLRLVVRWLDLIARLPILSGLNQIAGALLGGVQGLLLIWVAGLVVRICSGMQWAQGIILQIHAAAWLEFLYSNNVFNWIFVKILCSFV